MQQVSPAGSEIKARTTTRRKPAQKPTRYEMCGKRRGRGGCAASADSRRRRRGGCRAGRGLADVQVECVFLARLGPPPLPRRSPRARTAPPPPQSACEGAAAMDAVGMEGRPPRTPPARGRAGTCAVLGAADAIGLKARQRRGVERSAPRPRRRRSHGSPSQGRARAECASAQREDAVRSLRTPTSPPAWPSSWTTPWKSKSDALRASRGRAYLTAGPRLTCEI